MIESSFSNASFLLVCPEHKLQELKILFTNSFPQAYIYAIASIRLTKNFSKSLFSENTEIKKEIEEANWIVLSSSFAAQIFLEEIETEANLKEKLKQKKFASVGPSVSQLLERNGLVVALESPSLNIEGLNQAFESMLQEKEVANTKFLFITGNKTASGSLMNELEQKGANCFQLEIYTTKNNDTPDLESVKVFSNSSQLNKIICFTSPEAVSAFKEITVNAKLEISNSAFVACLGPLTAQRAKILFPGNLIEHASNYSYNGLIQLCNKLLQ